MLVRNKAKKLLTRILSFTLALMMCMPTTTGLEVHATNTNDSADNTGGGNGGMNASSSKLAWSGTYQGYRFYVINNNLERISQVYDFVYATPSAGEYLMTTRFDTVNSPATSTSNIYSISKLMQWTESSEAVPEPTTKQGSERVGNGATFKKWFFNGTGGSSIFNGLNNGGGGGSTSSHTHYDINGDHLCDADNCGRYTSNNACAHVDSNRDSRCDKCGSTITSSCAVCGYTPCMCNVVCGDCMQPIRDCLWRGNHQCVRCPAPPCKHLEMDFCTQCDTRYNVMYEHCSCCLCHNTYPCPGEDEICSYCKKSIISCKCDNKLTFSTQPTSSDPLVQSYITAIISRAELYKYHDQTITDKKAVKKAYNYIYDAAVADRDIDEYTYSGNSIKISNAMYDAFTTVKKCLEDKGVIGNLWNKLFGYNYNEDLLSTNIPLAGGGRGMPAYNLVNKSDTIKVNGYISAAEALADGCYLVVEPITWLHVRKNNGSWSSESTYNSYRTYGTWWNLASVWVGRTSGSFHSTVMSKLFVNCLATSKDVTTKPSKKYPNIMGGKTLTAPSDASSQKDASVALPLTNSYVGLSMHMYDATDFEDIIPVDKDTSTYDEPLGRDPGPAPDDSGKLSEDEKSTTQKHANIVKFYEDRGNGDKFSYTRTPTPKKIVIEHEIPTGYVVTDWYTSLTFKSASGGSPTYSEYKNSMGKNQQGTQPKTVELGDAETTLYVLLVKSSAVSNSDYTLHESEISKPITMGSALSETEIPLTLDHLDDNCNGHCSHRLRGCDDCEDGDPIYDSETGDITGYEPDYCGHSSCSGGSSCTKYCRWEMNDKSMTVKLKHLTLGNYPNLIIKSGSGFAPNVTTSTLTRDDSRIKAGIMYADGIDTTFVIYRGDDKLNYAKYKYNQSTLGFAPKSIKTTKTRQSADYTKGIVLKFGDDGSDLVTTSKGKTDVMNQYHCNDTDTAKLPNEILTHQVNILVQVYSGISRTPDTNINANPRMTVGTSGNLLMMGRMINTNTSVKFNPYIQMTYAGMSGSKTKVQVLSEFRREILPNDYAEISWTQSNGNLLVQSQMWALDADLSSNTDDRVWTGLNQVLKGGATLQLTDKDKQKVTLSTYQTVVEDTSRDISEITGTYDLTIDKAKDYHREFVENAKQTLDKAELVQWVSKTVDGSPAWEDGATVKRGEGISFLDNGSSTASREDKYYLDTDANNNKNSQRSDLDIKELGTKTLKYRFYSDVEGNIYMKKTDNSGATTTTKILNKKQGVEVLSGEALAINNRTYAVQKLLAALERNAGNDTTASWASDGRWYNEAYAGITVYVQHTDIQVGLTVGVNPLRTMVLDPKLIPQVTSKKDQGTTAFSSAFKVDLDQNTPIGKFKGTDIFMASPDMLFHSRNIYITNMTVDDNR